MEHETRVMHDSLGDMDVPRDAYYGAQTARALQNFPISGMSLPYEFVRAQAQVKWASACAHRDLGALPPAKADAICRAAADVAEGKLNAWFRVDVYQAGAGTSQNMNVNEVIAARASELLTGQRGNVQTVHPNDDVNKSQSTNDTFHVAMNMAGLDMLANQLDPAIALLEDALRRQANAQQGIVKAGRTHLQDAVPMRLSDEFEAYADNLSRMRRWLEDSAQALLPLGMGGNAIGTGINAPPTFGARAVGYIASLTGRPFRLADNPFVFNQNPDEVVWVSAALRSLSLALQRMANDIRLMASGPRTGFGEIALPTVQPGSSIMPGKVNPVMAEMLNMVAYQVQGCDVTIALAGGAGQLELNVMMPVMAANFLHEIRILANATTAFAHRCIAGIEANRETCQAYAEKSLALATALNTAIGYERAAEVVHYAQAQDATLEAAGLALGVDEQALKRALDVHALAVPTRAANPAAGTD